LNASRLAEDNPDTPGFPALGDLERKWHELRNQGDFVQPQGWFDQLSSFAKAIIAGYIPHVQEQQLRGLATDVGIGLICFPAGLILAIDDAPQAAETVQELKQAPDCKQREDAGLPLWVRPRRKECAG